MSWLVFGVFAGIGLILLMRWLSLSKPGQAKRALTWGLVSIIVLTAAFLAMTGRLAWAGAALSALIPWIQKMHPDAGGSDALAAQINQARDVLMGKK